MSIKLNDKFLFQCDSSELFLEDYNCSIDSIATITGHLLDCEDSPLYCTFDTIDGDSNVTILLAQDLINKYGERIGETMEKFEIKEGNEYLIKCTCDDIGISSFEGKINTWYTVCSISDGHAWVTFDNICGERLTTLVSIVDLEWYTIDESAFNS